VLKHSEDKRYYGINTRGTKNYKKLWKTRHSQCGKWLESIAKQALQWIQQSHRGRWRPNKTWKKQGWRSLGFFRTKGLRFLVF